MTFEYKKMYIELFVYFSQNFTLILPYMNWLIPKFYLDGVNHTWIYSLLSNLHVMDEQIITCKSRYCYMPTAWDLIRGVMISVLASVV